MENFEGLGLPLPLMRALETLKFSVPTPIQAMAIPPALAGKDILGSAQTGTGKTAAFALPLLAYLLQSPEKTALVMTPTRELAVQVMQFVRSLTKSGILMNTALLIGGESIGKQFQQLRSRPRIVIGTPGRINDHLERRSLALDAAGFLVLDETDRMLDMGFGPQIDRIVKHLPPQRQTLMFSATLPEHIVRLAGKYLRNPERLAAGSVSKPAANIKQDIVRTETAGKHDALLTELNARSGSIIVFVKTKHGADRLARKLEKEGHEADAIHGGLKQSRRDRVIMEFRQKKIRVLVATDVAARGLDIPHIEHVVNYDLPQCAEDYIHRIGRTARAGAEGAAVCLLTREDGAKWSAIQRLLHPEQRTQDGPYKPEGRSRPSGRPSGRPGRPGNQRPGASRRPSRHHRKGRKASLAA